MSIANLPLNIVFRRILAIFWLTTHDAINFVFPNQEELIWVSHTVIIAIPLHEALSFNGDIDPRIKRFLNMPTGCVRIIGGQWRGRKLRFPATNDLRPTPARVRETLFNWLAPMIEGAHCLDLFAGSGALGLEALSRGANYIALLDRSPKVVQYLQKQLRLWEIETKASVQRLQFPSQALTCSVNNFDVVFLDPPFRKNMLARCCHWLEQQTILAVNASIYLECEAELQPLPIPSHWKINKDKVAGQVRYCLLKRHTNAEEDEVCDHP